MNVHKKTQLTHARIKCALKDSSCETPLSKNMKLIILASNATLSLTNLIKFPHIKNYYIFTHKGSQFKLPKLILRLTLTKMNIMHELILARMRFSCAIVSPRFILVSSMMQPIQATLARLRNDSFLDDIIELVIKPNQDHVIFN